ncbi:MAG: hypothetical protein KIS88_10585 [Anaerolineales bacterium]|nr:hypothetical protein [Anaerolineales bacterium]
MAHDDPKAVQTLDRLCKKLDVTRKLRAFYTKDLSRNARPVADVQPSYLPLAVALLLSFAQAHGDLKFLNSALKVLDGNLTQRSLYPPELETWARSLVAELVK